MLSAKQNIDLLERVQRTMNLRRAIERNLRDGGRVLDAGCGSGILSIWSAMAGAGEVVAVDNGSMEMPRALAAANGCLDRIDFVQADLNDLPAPGEDGRFDLLLAMIYLNDPRRDLGQIRLAHRLARDFVRRGGEMIPDKVVHTAVLASWPEQNLPTRNLRSVQRVRALEELYGMKMEPLAEARLARPEKEDFPARGQDGRLASTDYRVLSEAAIAMEHDYRDECEPEVAGSVPMTLTQDGIADVVIWCQKLYYRGTLLFSNESISWLRNPGLLRAGERHEILLGPGWQDTNIVELAATRRPS